MALLILGQAGPAQADSATEQARQHYANGTKQYDMGHWDEAIAAFEKAYELRPDPSFIYNLAQAHRRKGDLKRALDLYKNFAIKLPKGPQRDEVEEKIASLQKQIDGGAGKPAATGAETPSASPSQAGEAPMATSANPVAPSPAATEPWPAFIPPAASPTAPAAPPEANTSIPVAAGEPMGPRPGRGLRVGGIVCGSAGVASIITGAVFGLRARSLSTKVTDAKQFNSSDDSAGKSAATLQWVFYGIGAGAVVAGGVLYYLGATAAPEASPRLSLSPLLAPNATGLSAAGVF